MAIVRALKSDCLLSNLASCLILGDLLNLSEMSIKWRQEFHPTDDEDSGRLGWMQISFCWHQLESRDGLGSGEGGFGRGDAAQWRELAAGD